MRGSRVVKTNTTWSKYWLCQLKTYKMRMRIYKIKRIKCCKLHLAQSLQSLYVRESGFRNPRNFCFWNPVSGKIFARGMWNPELWNTEYSSGIRKPSSTDNTRIVEPESTTVLDSLTRCNFKNQREMRRCTVTLLKTDITENQVFFLLETAKVANLIEGRTKLLLQQTCSCF